MPLRPLSEQLEEALGQLSIISSSELLFPIIELKNSTEKLKEQLEKTDKIAQKLDEIKSTFARLKNNVEVGSSLEKVGLLAQINRAIKDIDGIRKKITAKHFELLALIYPGIHSTIQASIQEIIRSIPQTIHPEIELKINIVTPLPTLSFLNNLTPQTTPSADNKNERGKVLKR